MKLYQRIKIYFKFQVNVGAEWYLHTIYTVRSSSKKVRRHVIARRAVSEQVGSIGMAFNRGTNMHPIQLLDEATGANTILAAESSTSWILAAILGAVLLGIFNFQCNCGKNRFINLSI